jgi:trans-2,3-dihydro-3-hydroxyanthranilate isomerase
MAPVRDASVLDRVRPAPDLVAALAERAGGTVLYLAAFDEARGIAHARGFFVNPDGLKEDPATGSAAGPLCAYLHARTQVSAVIVHQGVAMGRPSLMHAGARRAEDGVRAWIGGGAVPVLRGTLQL